jgi:hypothetical protein
VIFLCRLFVGVFPSRSEVLVRSAASHGFSPAQLVSFFREQIFWSVFFLCGSVRSTVPHGSYHLGSRWLFCLPSLDSVAATCSNFSCSRSSRKNLTCALRTLSCLGLHRSACKCSAWAAGSQLVKPQVALQFLGSCSVLLPKFLKFCPCLISSFS